MWCVLVLPVLSTVTAPSLVSHQHHSIYNRYIYGLDTIHYACPLQTRQICAAQICVAPYAIFHQREVTLASEAVSDLAGLASNLGSMVSATKIRLGNGEGLKLV